MPKLRASFLPPSIPVWTRSPSEHYIKFLLSDPDKENIPLADFAAKLRNSGVILPPQDVKYLQRLELDLEERGPDPFFPDDLRHGPSQAFLQKEQIWSMWHPDRSVEEAVTIFSIVGVREHINALLVSDLSPAVIVALVAKQLGINYLEESILAYQHYYWNIGLLSVEEQERVFADTRAGSVVMQAHIVGKGVLGRTSTLRRLGYNTDVPSSRNVFELGIEEAAEVLSHLREIPIGKRSIQLLQTVQAAFISLRGVNETQAGASSTMLDLRNQLRARRTESSPVVAADIGTKRFKPKGLPGRGELTVIDMEEVRSDRSRNEGSG